MDAAVLLSSSAYVPTWAWDFSQKLALPAGSTFTRGSAGWYFNSSGVLVQVSSNNPRYDYDPGTLAPLGYLAEMQATNSIRNNTMVGAVAGTPGTTPTNWSATSTADGVTRTIVGTGTEDGISYIDIRYFGTPSASSSKSVFFDGVTAHAALSGQFWAGSVYLRLVGGSLTNTAVTHFISERDSGGSTLASTSSGAIAVTSAALRTQRSRLTRTLTNASTAAVTTTLGVTYTNGAALDLTLRIGLPQFEGGGVGATSPIPTTGSTVTRSQDILTMPLTSLPGWNASAGGVLVAKYRLNALIPGTQWALAITNAGSINDSVTLRPNLSGAGTVRATTSSSGAGQISLAGGSSPALFAADKWAFGWSATRAASARNGGTPATSSGAYTAPATLTQIEFGRLSSECLNGTLEGVAYYAGARSDAFCAQVSR